MDTVSRISYNFHVSWNNIFLLFLGEPLKQSSLVHSQLQNDRSQDLASWPGFAVLWSWWWEEMQRAAKLPCCGILCGFQINTELCSCARPGVNTSIPIHRLLCFFQTFVFRSHFYTYLSYYYYVSFPIGFNAVSGAILQLDQRLSCRDLLELLSTRSSSQQLSVAMARAH